MPSRDKFAGAKQGISDTEQLTANYISVECELGFTFLQGVLLAVTEEQRSKSLRRAIGALNAAHRFIPTITNQLLAKNQYARVSKLERAILETHEKFQQRSHR